MEISLPVVEKKLNDAIVLDPVEKKKAYAREYMRNRYAEKHTEVRNYNNSVRYKLRHNLSDEDFKKYGSYLHLVDKVKKAKAELPADLWEQLMSEL